MNKRLICTIVLVIALMAFPYWIYLPLIFVASIVFPFYWEGIILAFLVDVLYGVQTHSTISFVYPFAIIASIIILVMLPIRERIRFNA